MKKKDLKRSNFTYPWPISAAAQTMGYTKKIDKIDYVFPLKWGKRWFYTTWDSIVGYSAKYLPLLMGFYTGCWNPYLQCFVTSKAGSQTRPRHCYQIE